MTSAFVEINEGRVIVGTNGNGDGLFPKYQKHHVDTLLGVNNEIKYANNYKQSGWAMKTRNVEQYFGMSDPGLGNGGMILNLQSLELQQKKVFSGIILSKLIQVTEIPQAPFQIF